MKTTPLRDLLLKYFPDYDKNTAVDHVIQPSPAPSPPVIITGAPPPSWQELVTRKATANGRWLAATARLQKVDTALVNAFIEYEGATAAAEMAPPLNPDKFLNDKRTLGRLEFLDGFLPDRQEQLELALSQRLRRETDLATLGSLPPLPKPPEMVKTTATLALTFSMGIAFEAIFEGWLFPLLAWTLALGFGWAFAAFMVESALPAPDSDREEGEQKL